MENVNIYNYLKFAFHFLKNDLLDFFIEALSILNQIY